MANYKAHLTGGALWGIGSMGVIVWALGLNFAQGFAAMIMGIFGAVLPDLDCDTGKPIQLLSETVGLLLAVLLFFRFFGNKLTAEYVVCIMFPLYLIIRFGITFVISYFTTHRGIMHSIPVAIIAGATTFLLFSNTEFYPRLLISLACTGGVFVHLIMDEIWSVDVYGMKIKQSFGSALSLRGHSILGTLLAYVVMIGMLAFIYTHTTIPPKFYKNKTLDSIVEKIQNSI